MVKNPPANAGDMGLILESGRFLGEGNGNPLQYSCLGKPMDREAWWATVHGLADSDTTEHRSTLLLFSLIRLFRDPHGLCSPRASLSMGFPRQEYWSGLPFPSPGDLPNPGIEPMSHALAGGFFTTELPGKPRSPYWILRIFFSEWLVVKNG